MEQIVRVRKTFNDGTAQVLHVRESACSGDCHKCSGCGAAKEGIELMAKNPIGAKSFTRLKVYRGAEHNQQAQKPVTL